MNKYVGLMRALVLGGGLSLVGCYSSNPKNNEIKVLSVRTIPLQIISASEAEEICKGAGETLRFTAYQDELGKLVLDRASCEK